MAIGISVIICLLMLILFAIGEVWCKVEDVQATLSWLIQKIAHMQGIIDMYADEDEETEAQQEG